MDNSQQLECTVIVELEGNKQVYDVCVICTSSCTT